MSQVADRERMREMRNALRARDNLSKRALLEEVAELREMIREQRVLLDSIDLGIATLVELRRKQVEP